MFLLKSNAQVDSVKNERKSSINPWGGINGIRLSSGYLSHLEFESAFLITNFPKRDPGLAGLAMRIEYIGIGIEYLRIGQKNALGAKLSYENSIGFLAAQLGTDFITDGVDLQVRILPKIGISYFGVWTLYYGYNINTIAGSNLQSPNHFISLQLNLLNY